MMNKIIEKMLFWFVYVVLYTLYRTYRVDQIKADCRNEAIDFHPKGAYLLSLWHEHLIACSFAQKGLPLRPLVSRSFVGRLVAFVYERFGFHPVHGSQNRNGKDKGGKEARNILLDSLAQGYCCGITVDGSVGPRRKVKPGVVSMAAKSKSMILPVANTASRYWELNTWDKLKIPKPFSRVVIAYGKPISVIEPLEKDQFEFLLRKVEDGINQSEVDAIDYLHRLQGGQAIGSSKQ